jgi:hypothetical protein
LAPPQIAVCLWSLDYGSAVDLGFRWWESFTPCFESFVLVFRVKVCRGGAQVVVAASRAIRSTWLQPHLDGNIERLVRVVWSSRISSSCGDFWIVRELYWQFFLLRLRDGCRLLDPFDDFPSTTNNVRPTQVGVAATARRRHGLEVEDEGLLKDLVIIFIFLNALYY